MQTLLTASRSALACSRRTYHKAGHLVRLKQHVRWPILAACSARAYASWLEALGEPHLKSMLQRQPGLSLKPLRPYVSLQWTSQRRFKVISESGEFLANAPHRIRQCLESRNGELLAGIAVGNGGLTRVVAGWDARFRKEGELVISLGPINGARRFMSLSLAFERDINGRWIGYIACVQGGDESPEEIRKFTRAHHGLRPAALLLFVAQELLRGLGVRQILGVGNRVQVSRRKHLIPVPWRRIRFDYDAHWTSAGGSPTAEGWYVLPLVAPRRARQEIEPPKRALYARRYELMDRIAAQVRLCAAAAPEVAPTVLDRATCR